jgi:DNA (cytosine-5)-methyltransferase 1
VAKDGDGGWVIHLGTGRTHQHQGDAGQASPTVTSRANRWVVRPRAAAADDAVDWQSDAVELIRLSVGEAGVLQSFPASYPWRGGRTSRYRQAGNAFPPAVAAHVLAVATGMAAPATPSPADSHRATVAAG